MKSPEQTVIDLMAESPDLEEKRRELDAEYPQYQGCRNKNGDNDMNLYLITQDKVGGYDIYDSAVVAAKSPDDARKINPSSFVTHVTNGKWMGTYSGGNNIGAEYEKEGSSWVQYADIDCVEVEYLGKTEKDRGVVLASFNAG